MTPTFTGTLYWLFNFQFQLCQWKFAHCLIMLLHLMTINQDLCQQWDEAAVGLGQESDPEHFWRISTWQPAGDKAVWLQEGLQQGQGEAGAGASSGGHQGLGHPPHVIIQVSVNCHSWKSCWHRKQDDASCDASWYKWCRLFHHHQKLNGLSTFILKILGLPAEWWQIEQKFRLLYLT